jgi:hypothetical protein
VSAKIAVFKNDVCKNDLPITSVTVTVFESNNGRWNNIYKDYVNILPSLSVGGVREALDGLIDGLGDCRIAAGTGVAGVLYRALDNRGFSIFETEDVNPDTLDGILGDLNAADAADAAEEVPVRPVETETPGVYALNLVRLQAVHPEISSKQALSEFLDVQPFYELRLTCTHLPPWLESGPYEITKSACDGALVAAVRKKQCNGG